MCQVTNFVNQHEKCTNHQHARCEMSKMTKIVNFTKSVNCELCKVWNHMKCHVGAKNTKSDNKHEMCKVCTVCTNMKIYKMCQVTKCVHIKIVQSVKLQICTKCEITKIVIFVQNVLSWIPQTCKVTNFTKCVKWQTLQKLANTCKHMKIVMSCHVTNFACTLCTIYKLWHFM